MFPIVPNHATMGNARQRPSTGTASGSNSDRQLWNMWSGSVECKAKVQKRITKPNEVTFCDNVGGFATMLIPKNSKSNCIDPADGYPSSSINIGKKPVHQPFQLTLSPRGHIRCVDDRILEHIWLKQLRLSMDVHSNNTILELHTNANDSSAKELCLRALRNIEAGEELLLWFSEEILALMLIPFLTPANIRGKNSYTCNTCEKTFENPNPLKVHIATNCEQQSQQHLWTRLQTSLPRSKGISSNELSTISSLHYHHSWLTNAQVLIPYHQQHLQDQQQQQRRSAFQPVLTKCKIEPIEISSNRNSPPSAPATMFSVQPHHLHNHHHRQHQLDQTATAAAHLETIVSNMGTSKQGHLCIYCGKLYSRKYGLKIHIRTHTGFKPLKCKYCLRPFGDPSNLNKHVRLHVQGSTIYKCPECDKILVRRRDLQRHIQSRHTLRLCADDNSSKNCAYSESSVSSVSSCAESSDEGNSKD